MVSAHTTSLKYNYPDSYDNTDEQDVKSQYVRWFGSISFTVLLISSFYVLANSTVSHASSTDEVGAASGSNRFVVWVNDTEGFEEVWFRRSTDNGATWQPRVNLANSYEPSLNPQITVSGSNVYVVWEDYAGWIDTGYIYFRLSTDNGATWGPTHLVSETCPIGVGPQIAVSGSNVFVVFHAGACSFGGTNDIWFARSTDNGNTWQQPPVNLSNNPGDSFSHLIAVSGSNVYVVWNQENADGSLSDVFFRRSTDSGATWKFAKNLSSNGHSRGSGIAVAGSNVYVTWTDNTSGKGESFLRRSTDNGATWKVAKNLSNNPGDSFTASIAISGGKLYAVWSDSNPSNFDILFRRSTDNGVTWTSVKNLSNNPGDSYGPQIAVSGANVHVAWTQENQAGTLSDVFFRRSTDNGVTWKFAKNLSSNGHSYGSQIAVAGSNVYVVWGWIDSSGNPDIFVRRSADSGASWQSAKNLSNNANGSYSPQIAV